MIKPNEVVLTKLDRVKILFNILNDMLPWQIPAIISTMALITHVIMLNNAQWYFDLNSFSFLIRLIFSLVLGFAETLAIAAVGDPILRKVEARWENFERDYRIQAVKKVDEYLLAQKAGTDDE